MQQRVKEFIEKYINEIELQRWKDVFDAWYRETDVDEFWKDDEDFSELLGVLEILEIHPETIVAARQAVLSKYTEDIVNTIQHNFYNRVDSWNISWIDVLFKLQSLLGFSQEYIFTEIFNEVDLAGITPDQNRRIFVVEGL